MSANLYLLSLSLIRQAKLRFANDEAYRPIAEKAAATQAETANALHSIEVTLSDINNRLMKIEKVLKGIE